MGWNHETVFKALVDRGLREEKLSTKHYVVLYPQEQKNNCALLYHPDSPRFAVNPLLMHPGRESWRPEIYSKLLPAIEFVRLDKKSASQKSQSFLHCKVVDWNLFAKAVGLE